MSADGVPTGVGKTALGVAAVRAMESGRADRLFDDPLAAAFLAAAPGAFDAEQRAAEGASADEASWGRTFAEHAALRTKFFDDHLLHAADAGARQVVLLAAGLDTRAYRLPWPAGTHLCEVDTSDVLGFKEEVIAEQQGRPACTRAVVEADLREDWLTALVTSGFNPAARTAWLAEGIMIYLSAEEAAGLFSAISSASTPGATVAFEYFDPGEDPTRLQAARSKTMQQYTALWKGGLPDPVGWLREHGWRSEARGWQPVGHDYGRNVRRANGGLVTASLT